MPERENRAVYVISVAAELAGVHPQTLRIYERKGLLDPARTGGGGPRHNDQDIDPPRRNQGLPPASTGGTSSPCARPPLPTGAVEGSPRQRSWPGEVRWCSGRPVRLAPA